MAHHDPVEPSDDAKQARADAERALDRADTRKEETVEKVAEAAALVAKLAGHRRANSFVDMFREAFGGRR